MVNVSSPNTPGLRDLQSVEALRPILEAMRVAADEATAPAGLGRVPLLVKIAPDLSDEDVDAVAELAPSWGWTASSRSTRPSATTSAPAACPARRVLARGLDVVARLRDRLGPGRGDHRRGRHHDRRRRPRVPGASARPSCRATPA